MRRYAHFMFAATLLAVPACELGQPTTFLDDETYVAPVEGKLAVSEDANQVWLPRTHSNGNEELVGFSNPGASEFMSTGSFSSSVAITDLSAAHEPGSEGGVWTLHANGFRLRFDENGVFDALSTGANIEDAFPAGPREWCGLAMGLDGSAYVMAGHQEGTFTHWHLYRELDGVVTRAGGPFPSLGCPEIAYDLPLDEIAVAVDGGYGSRDVIWFDPDTMEETHQIEIVAEPHAIAVFDHKVAVGRASSIWIWNEDGTVADSESGVHVEDLDVQYGNNQVRLWWSGTGPDDVSTVGSYQLL
ncbi:MAG: hypothetical protein ACE37F_32215 [Nannocystaceae bacterium]|nr:hypothetical protein [bacterium]